MTGFIPKIRLTPTIIVGARPFTNPETAGVAWERLAAFDTVQFVRQNLPGRDGETRLLVSDEVGSTNLMLWSSREKSLKPLQPPEGYSSYDEPILLDNGRLA